MPPSPIKNLWRLGATPYSVALKFLPHLFRGRPTIARHAEIPQFVIPLCHTYSMTEKLIEVNNIYAQMAELSDSSLRPHPWVMGFSYGRDGGISIWWDHAYESSQYLLGKLDLVDWFHEGFFIADRMVQLVPLPEEKNLILPGIMIVWRPVDGEAKISKLVEDYIKGYQNVT